MLSGAGVTERQGRDVSGRDGGLGLGGADVTFYPLSGPDPTTQVNADLHQLFS